MDESASLLLSLVVTSVYWIILLPICIKIIWNTWRVRKSVIMKKRHINASLLCCLCVSIWFFIESPMSYYMVLYEDEINANMSYKLIKCFWHTMYPFASQGAAYCLLYRFWMIYYKFMESESLQNEQWKIQINPKGCSRRERWIIDHRKTFGNRRWVAKRLFFVYFICASTSAFFYGLVIFDRFPGELWENIDSVVFITPLILQFVLWCKMPHFLGTVCVYLNKNNKTTTLLKQILFL